jgi:type I restriction enzyme S subunit
LLGSETTYKIFHRLHKNSFVLSQLKGWEGALSLIPDEFDGYFLSPQFPTFSAIENRLDIQYLNWYCKQSKVWESLRQKSQGMGARRDSVSAKKFLSLNIPLPPIAEQRRIVARIEELAAKIEEARGLRESANIATDALAKAAMGRFFNPNAKYQSVRLKDACTAIIDNLHSNPVYSDQGIPCIRSSDVGWGDLNLETARKTSEEEYQRRTVRGEPTIDDIVFVREGGGTGKIALVKEGQRFSLGQRVMMLRPDKDKILPKFFLYQLLSPFLQEEQIQPRCTGSASPHLNIGDLKKFPFLLPLLHEQRQIVSYLDSIQSKVNQAKKLRGDALKEFDALLPAILDKAFKGEL